MKTLFLLIIGFGSFMGACALMTWGSWYNWLAIVTFLGNLYCISCVFDEDDKKKKERNDHNKAADSVEDKK